MVEDRKTLTEPVLIVEDLHKRYGRTEVLKGISFEVMRGETKVIIGPSGAGKSTLLRCINLLVKPDKGRIILEGEEITKPGVNLSKVRAKIGFVFQHFNLFRHLTALDNVRIGLMKVKGLSKEEATEIAARALKSVGITEDLWDHYPAQLSGGQQQRVAIARAIAMEPTIILFDEPTSALDPELIGEVLKVMEDLARKKMTMLVVTHEMGFAMNVADEILFVDDGRIIERGPPRQILFNPQHERTRRFLSRIRELYQLKDRG